MNLVRAASLIAAVTIFTMSPVAAKKSKKKKLVIWNCTKLMKFSVTDQKYFTEFLESKFEISSKCPHIKQITVRFRIR